MPVQPAEPRKLKQFKLTETDLDLIEEARDYLRPVFSAVGVTRSPTDADVLRYVVKLFVETQRSAPGASKNSARNRKKSG